MRTFGKLGFDIAYLALLTQERVKPLSRWEGRFSRRQVRALRSLGLKTDTVDRKLLNGSTKPELIFSASSHYLNLYRRKYHRTPITKDQRTVRTEGFLFGYPSCCVDNFAEHGYSNNEFVGRGQEILFHWACPGCRATPELLPHYRRIHDHCRQMLPARRPVGTQLLRASLPAAALSAIIALTAGRSAADDPHWYCSTAVDTGHNFLTSYEDFLLGTSWEHISGYIPDYIPGGPSQAMWFQGIIDSLPNHPADLCCYLEWQAQFGSETCSVCGEPVNMGSVVIHNPMRDISVKIPIISLHYLSHGSFSFDGSEHAGRVDIGLLRQVLAHYDTTHYTIETTNDADKDGLRDDFEDHFGTLINDPDSNQNQLVDGAEVAERFTDIIAQIPRIPLGQTPPSDFIYMTFMPADGIETCDICGHTIAMGLVTIVNPLNAAEISFPNMALHYLAHGRFSYHSAFDPGEINAARLDTVLSTPTISPGPEPRPQEHRLELYNYPNPFNSGTRINFFVPETDRVSLRIYNVKGQLVRTLLDETASGGHHRIGWNGLTDDGVAASSGVYFCRLEQAGRLQTTKMLLLK